MNFYISDLHFGHANVIKFDKRPFQDVDEMDFELIKRINEKCSEDDDLYILGDLTFYKNAKKNIDLVSQLKPNLHLVSGNHDFWIKSNYMNYLFDSINNYLRIKDEKRDVILFHYPIFNWDNQKHGSYHLYGHVHNNPDYQMNAENSFNVGCMMHDYYPVSLDELIGD